MKNTSFVIALLASALLVGACGGKKADTTTTPSAGSGSAEPAAAGSGSAEPSAAGSGSGSGGW